MARAAVKAKQAQKAQATAAAKPRRDRKHASGGNPNQDLFFSRIRRRQRWVFLGLAILFAVSFTALGVGSGTGGLQGIYNSILGNGNDPISQANGEIDKGDLAKGYRDLATAYVSKNDVPSAIGAMQTYLKTKQGRTDASAWQLLGEYERTQADMYFRQYQQVEQSAALAAPSQALTPPDATLAATLGTNPIDAYYQQQTQAQAQPLLTNATSAYTASMTAYQHQVKSSKGQSARTTALQNLAQAAQYAGQTKLAPRVARVPRAQPALAAPLADPGGLLAAARRHVGVHAGQDDAGARAQVVRIAWGAARLDSFPGGPPGRERLLGG
jgi:hypothetical protein